MTCNLCEDEPGTLFFDGPPDPQTRLIKCPNCHPLTQERLILLLVSAVIVAATIVLMVSR